MRERIKAALTSRVTPTPPPLRALALCEWGCFEARPDKAAHSLARRPDASFQIFFNLHTRAGRKMVLQEREKERRGLFSGTRKQDEGKPGSRCSNRSPTTYAAPAVHPISLSLSLAVDVLRITLVWSCSARPAALIRRLHSFLLLLLLLVVVPCAPLPASFFLSLMNF